MVLRKENGCFRNDRCLNC